MLLTKKQASTKQEHQIADYLGWRVISASGARHLHPGDIESDKWLAECKTHTRPDHPIMFNYEVWKKIVDESASKFRYPVLMCDDGSQLIDRTWCMFPGSISDPTMLSKTVNFKIRENISVTHEVLLSLVSELGTIGNATLRVRFHKHWVHITSLESFRSMFGE